MQGDITARLAPIPGAANLAVGISVLVLNAILLVAIPVWLLPRSAAWGWLLVPIVLTTPLHWSIIHEAIHGNGLAGTRHNAAFGRLLAILFGSPFYALRFGHLSHHALNGRRCDRPEVYDPRTTSRLRAAADFYTRLLFGLYATEFLASVIAWLPRPRLEKLTRQLFHEGEMDAGILPAKAVHHILAPARLKVVRQDAAVILFLYGTSFALYGAYWPLLVLALVGRGLIVSLLDGAPHYGAVLGDPDQGYNLYLPCLASRLILNFNYHGVHHRHPGLPWTALPIAFENAGATFDGHYLVAPLKQLAGPVPIDALPEMPALPCDTVSRPTATENAPEGRKDTMWGLILAAAVVSGTGFSASAEPNERHHSPYRGEETRLVKSLSAEDIKQLSTGQGWGLAKAAELNGLPGPMHLLEMRDALRLSSDQVQAIEAIFEDMRQRAIPLGRRLIDQERALNEQFANNTVTPEKLHRQLDAIAETTRELRYVHLAAHLETPRLLTPHQIALYSRLRGYGDGHHDGGHRRH